MDSDEVVRGLSLLSFIIKPVQRLCKYPLLLRVLSLLLFLMLIFEELIANTDPALPEHQRLIDAAAKVGETVDYVNAMQRQSDFT